MKNLILSAMASVCLIMALSSCNTSTEKHDFVKLEAEVQEMFSRSLNLFKAKDVNGLVNRFTEDGILKIPSAPLVIGHDALRSNYENTVKLENFEIGLLVNKVIISKAGDMAYAIADFSVSFNTPGGPFADKGSTLMVLHRIGDEWKIAAEYLSSGPAGKP